MSHRHTSARIRHLVKLLAKLGSQGGEFAGTITQAEEILLSAKKLLRSGYLKQIELQNVFLALKKQIPLPLNPGDQNRNQSSAVDGKPQPSDIAIRTDQIETPVLPDLGEPDRNEISTVEGTWWGPNIAKQIGRIATPVSNQTLVQKLVERRQIKSLYHFTPDVNFGSILDKGILPRSNFESGPTEPMPMFSDSVRADRCKDASCCTISFPNYKMFYKLQKLDSDRIWAVIGLNPALLWSNECLFNKTNAANKDCSTISRSERSTANALEAMFADSISQRGPKRSSLGLSDSIPTDPQAEVLVIGQIPVTSILRVAFKNQIEQNKVERRLPHHLKCLVRMEVDPKLFKPRTDWEHWKNYQKETSERVSGDLDDEIPF